MPIISALPFTLTNGTTADATQVMADFDQIVTGVNTNAAAASGGTLTLATITSSTINSSTIGATTPSTGSFTTLKATTLDSTPIGSVTPSTGAFTTLTASSTLGVTGATTLTTLATSGLATFNAGLKMSGSLLSYATPVTVASATTTDLGAALSNIITISGTTAITSFGATATAGQEFDLTFSGILTLTYNATSLILPTAANITTAAGDTAKILALGSSNFSVVSYQRASGKPLVSAYNTLYTNSSSPAAIGSNGSNGAIAHGLGATPTNMYMVIRCNTAEAGYAIGDEVSGFNTNGSNQGIFPSANATNLQWVIGSGGIFISNYGSGGNFSITKANWGIVFYAAL
jgi:hypothetical protein